jgi:diguanylate cyclase (GGDEF)-like protein
MQESGLNSVRRILAILPESNVLANWASQAGAQIQFCQNTAELLSLAAAGGYDLIFLHLHRVGGRIDHTLQSLRQAGPAGRIILLCSMAEEPLAIRLTQTAAAGKSADDYFIYPGGFTEWIHGWVAQQKNTLFPTLAEPTEALRHLEKLATEDDLTGLKNRRYIRQFLRQILDYARKDQFHVTILLFDIDNFKQYNDLYGHSVGDEVLRQVGEVMKRCCRAHDVVARIGGDEYAVVFWDLPSAGLEASASAERRKAVSGHPREPLFMAQRFCRQLREAKPPSLGDSGKGSLTISGGLASFPDDGDNEARLWEQADQAMLRAKQSGKNKILIVGKSDDSPDSPLAS